MEMGLKRLPFISKPLIRQLRSATHALGRVVLSPGPAPLPSTRPKRIVCLCKSGIQDTALSAQTYRQIIRAN